MQCGKSSPSAIEKHLGTIFNRCNSITLTIQVVTITAKEATEYAYRTVENAVIQRENEEGMGKENENREGHMLQLSKVMTCSQIPVILQE